MTKFDNEQMEARLAQPPREVAIVLQALIRASNAKRDLSVKESVAFDMMAALTSLGKTTAFLAACLPEDMRETCMTGWFAACLEAAGHQKFQERVRDLPDPTNAAEVRKLSDELKQDISGVKQAPITGPRRVVVEGFLLKEMSEQGKTVFKALETIFPITDLAAGRTLTEEEKKRGGVDAPVALAVLSEVVGALLLAPPPAIRDEVVEDWFDSVRERVFKDENDGYEVVRTSVEPAH